jgi:hypothetical protein
MALLTLLMLRRLILHCQDCENSSGSQEPLIADDGPCPHYKHARTTASGMRQSYIYLSTTCDQACSHGKLYQWHGRSHELLALHCWLFSKKTGSLPAVNPEPYKRKKKENHRLSHL